MVFTIDDSDTLAHETLICHLRDLMERVPFLVDQEAWLVQALLDVSLSEGPLNGFVLEHHIVLDRHLGLILFLQSLLYLLDCRLWNRVNINFLVIRIGTLCTKAWFKDPARRQVSAALIGFIDSFGARLEDDQAISLLMEELRHVALLKATGLVRDETIDESRAVAVKAPGAVYEVGEIACGVIACFKTI